MVENPENNKRSSYQEGINKKEIVKDIKNEDKKIFLILKSIFNAIKIKQCGHIDRMNPNIEYIRKSELVQQLESNPRLMEVFGYNDGSLLNYHLQNTYT